MSQTKYKKIAFWIVTTGIWQLITKHGYWHEIFCHWVVDYKDEGMLSHLDKKWKFLFNKFFWNFHISEKKSADFSCLFTFFQKNCKIILIFPTFWELHNCKFKLAICLHFWNQLIYVVILKCKQFVNFCSQLCNSQNVEKLSWFYNFFEKM